MDTDCNMRNPRNNKKMCVSSILSSTGTVAQRGRENSIPEGAHDWPGQGYESPDLTLMLALL